MLYKWEDRAKQLIDYTNLSWGVIHPTDIDGILEFNGIKLVLLEYKTGGKLVGVGQRLLLERVANNWSKAQRGNESLIVIADHYTKQDEIVDGGNCIVREVYYNGKWFNYKGYERTVRSVVGKFAKNEILQKIQEKNI